MPESSRHAALKLDPLCACAPRQLVAALCHPTPVEFSLGAAKGEAPPTTGQWEALLNQL